MTDRRQFLAGLAALPLSAAAGRSADTAASLADAIESVPCSDPTPGSVTNPRGAVGQTSLTDLVDAYSQVDGLDWQHQLFSVLTNKPDACAHYRQNQVVAYEKWLIVGQIAYRSDRQPAPFATGTYPAIQLDLQLNKIGKKRELGPHKKFRRASIWVSDDSDRLLLRVQASIFVGKVFAELQSVRFPDTGR